MNARELYLLLQEDKIAIKTNSHIVKSWGKDSTFEVFKETVCDRIKRTEEFIAKRKAENETFYEYDLVDPLDNILVGSNFFDYHCSNCGKRLFFRVQNQEIELVTATFPRDVKKDILVNSDSCVFNGKREPIRAQITITSPLVFVNHFRKFPETPENERYTDEYSLNYHMGRVNITKFLEQKNIGYGQVGNTSINVHLHHNKKKIILCRYAWDRLYDSKAEYAEQPTEELKKQIDFYQDIQDNYTDLGGISLGVWRWMCADEDTIKKYELPKIWEEESYHDVVKCDVPYGIWDITHYSNTDIDDDCLVAELNLRG